MEPYIPDKCDLVVYSDDLICSEYPRETTGGFEEEMSVKEYLDELIKKIEEHPLLTISLNSKVSDTE